MSNPNPNQNDDDPYDTRRHLGFKLNDIVVISNSFFQNHGIKVAFLGHGRVIAKIMPNATTLPALIVELPIHPVLLTNEHLKKLIIPTTQMPGMKGKHTVLIKIHPLYLEIVERADGGKEKHKRKST